MSSKHHKIKVGISVGDFNGIGVEIILKALKDKNIVADKIDRKGNNLVVTIADTTQQATALKELQGSRTSRPKLQHI